MATKRAQRISIWIIAIALAIGTIGSFLVIILANDNARTDQAKATQMYEQYQKDYQDYNNSLPLELSRLGAEYYSELLEYKSHPAKFDADEVTELKTKDLKVGDGEDLNSESTFYAFYIGWNPDGKIFDSSFVDGQEYLASPFEASPGGVIEGWTKGVDGMKVGGVRELTIPSDMAYGETGSGELIEPDMPLKFIIMVVPVTPAPEIPQELMDYYTRGVI